MHLSGCEHPQRVYNKYLNEYVWVRCGKCKTCLNSKAMRFTELLERERSQHVCTFFFTLTYNDGSLPVAMKLFDGREPEESVYLGERGDVYFNYSMLFDDLSKKYTAEELAPDIALFKGMSANLGIPYACKSDIQLFFKRLNKCLHDKFSFHYSNFRYWCISEFGSTTFRPHFHGLLFCDDSQVIEHMQECVSACWKYGLVDCQPVENSACAYVSQYINQLSDLPLFYEASVLRPFYLCSRRPFIGNYTKLPINDKELVDCAAVEVPIQRKGHNVLVNVPLLSSRENRLFPKCFSYGSLPDSMRAQLYELANGFGREEFGWCQDYKDFEYSIRCYLQKEDIQSPLMVLLSSKLSLDELDSLFDTPSRSFLKRCYYTSRLFLRNCKDFNMSTYYYMSKIKEHYDKKSLLNLKRQYELQEQFECEDCAIMYPEYLFENGMTVEEYASDYDIAEYKSMVSDSALFYDMNHKTHFKNAYLDSKKFRDNNPNLQKLLKTYFHAKKRYEIGEAFSS